VLEVVGKWHPGSLRLSAIVVLAALLQVKLKYAPEAVMIFAAPKTSDFGAYIFTTARSPFAVRSLDWIRESMKEKMVPFVLAMLMSGFLPQGGECRDASSQKPDISEVKCRIFVKSNNHKIIAWVNDEPVWVWDNVSAGSSQMFWSMLHKGINYVHFTAERFPREKTKDFASQLPNDGSTTIKLRSDVLGKPYPINAKDILVWRATKNSETSPHWSVHSDTSFRPPLDRYDSVTRIDERIRSQIKESLVRFKEALKAKDLSRVGLKESNFNEIMNELGLEGCTLAAIYASEPYYVDVAPLEKLRIIHGKKTVMVYHSDGEPIYFAGRDPSLPSKFGWSYSLKSSVMYFVLRNGKLQPLWACKY
jgi:hypothetical protein